ncbi:hypothetical protein CMI37_04260 [Candidatus Pacearchaeota archaeon]|nr:hypothetical protein [Candidatus Pacearchaeota archaeon]
MAASFASLLVQSINKSGLLGASKAAAGGAVAQAKEAARAKLDEHPVAKKTFDIMQDVGHMIKTQYKRGNMATGGQLTPMGALTGGVMGGVMGKAMFGMMGKVGITKMMPNMSKLVKGMLPMPNKLLGKAMGMLGINLSLSTLLRQSQLFTGILGALFQILGGFVDVILAPFMPLFVKVIQMLAAQIPKVREFAQKAYKWLDENVFPFIQQLGDWVWGKIKGVFGVAESFMPTVKEKIVAVWDWAKQFEVAIQLKLMQVWEWFKTHLLPTLQAAFEMFVGFGQTVWEWAKSTLWPAMETVFGTIKGVIEHSLEWLRTEMYPRISAIFNWLVNSVGTFIVDLVVMFVEFFGKIIPMITSIMTQLIDILIGQILRPLWDALEPILKWLVSFWMTNMEWFINAIDTKILPAIADIVDIIWPHVRKVIDAFQRDVMPVIDEAAAHIREFLDALLDVLIPILKFFFKIAFWAFEKYFRLLFKILAIAWKYVIGPIFKILTWLLRLPFRWKSQVVDPVMGVLNHAWEELKFIGRFLGQVPNMLLGLLMKSYGRVFAKIGEMKGGPFDLLGKIAKPFGDAGKWMQNFGEGRMTGYEQLKEDMLRAQRRRAAGPAGEIGYGGGIAVTINNMSSTGIVDDAKNFVVDADEQRKIDNMQDDGWNFGTYSSLDSNLKVA